MDNENWGVDIDADRDKLKSLLDIAGEVSTTVTNALGKFVSDATGEDGVFMTGKIPEDPRFFIFYLEEFLNHWNWKIRWASERIQENRS